MKSGRTAAWLDPADRDAATELLDSAERLAQEAIGLDYLSAHPDLTIRSPRNGPT